jgi:hypothetical protein
MPSESLDWRPLTPDTVKQLRGRPTILAIRGDGKGYYGWVSEITPEYVELTNGQQKQMLRLFDSPTQFATVKGPSSPSYRLGQPRLFGRNHDNG